MTATISLHNVHKSFGDKAVLRGVTLSVNKGESLVIIGGSGTGKSVTIKCILGLIAADSGSIMVNDREVVKADSTTLETIRRPMGMLFQGGALFDSLKVWHNVAFGLLQRGLPRAQAKEIAIQKLAAVGLDAAVGELYPASLSGGMQKRVGLARAIAADPEIIFFDEPTTGLDPIMADVINNLIRDLVKKLGATAISITHDMNSVRKIADKVAMIYNGSIIWHGDISALDNSQNPYVDQFIHGRATGPISVNA